MGDAERESALEVWTRLVDHADRCWKAEEENARRHANRANLALTTLVAFFGVGLFRFGTDPFLQVPDGRTSITVKTLLVFGLVFLGLAILALLDLMPLSFERAEAIRSKIREAVCWLCYVLSWGQLRGPQAKESKSAASAQLYEYERNGGLPAGVTDRTEAAYGAYLSWALTSLAAVELRGQNDKSRRRIDRGQQWYVIGLACMLLAVVFYIWGARPATLRTVPDGRESTGAEERSDATNSADGNANRPANRVEKRVTIQCSDRAACRRPARSGSAEHP